MASGYRRFLTLLLLAALMPAKMSLSQKYFPDDPIHVEPPPLSVMQVADREVDEISDFVKNSLSPDPRPPVPAEGINTLGDVPDNAWFTNRHEQHPMSREQLQRGPGTNNAPTPPFTIVGGKTAGASAGFRMEDSFGRLYFAKLDPVDHAEMMSGAEVITSKFLYAAGYNTPENYIVYAKLSDFRLSDRATISSRRMTWGDFCEIINRSPKSSGTFRILASLKVDGESVGPFRFQGIRKDDPNDIVRHENRRDLRGLAVVASWLNNNDEKADNTLDTIVEENGVRFIRHHLIDFGSALGSDGIYPKQAQSGHEFILPTFGYAAKRIVTVGLFPAEWEGIRYPDVAAVGNIASAGFKPEKWKSNYPNPAFLSRLPDDEFWGAKIVMAFRDDDIRAIVETGAYSDPDVVDYITATLAERRDRIGRACFSRVLPLDHFRVHNGELQFDDLAFRWIPSGRAMHPGLVLFG